MKKSLPHFKNIKITEIINFTPDVAQELTKS